VEDVQWFSGLGNDQGKKMQLGIPSDVFVIPEEALQGDGVRLVK
jgi:hypothetical protein